MPGLDTNLTQVLSAVPAPEAWPGLAVALSGVLPILVISAMRRLRQNGRKGKLLNHAEIVVVCFFVPTEVLF